ncbi:hypothetical protein [Pseudobdellovibrio exovorus]|uniref:Uncharacterized protein n=1 Tax=Pseudobdellovibrio exovorus JSS TaxID=1184267 RepID=M4V8Q9_9BACT|nr:hypothetical protein [Pseudobdellovibrio exovorus]AGH94401.1 hypothetical protein A11Q_181 [Pseudobdellovibrio exovorus JSS]
MPSNIKGIVFSLLCFTFGLSLFFSIYQSPESRRVPASAQGPIYQLQNMSAEEIQSQLRSKIRIRPTTAEGIKTIAFADVSSNVCKTYSNIEMEFYAEGVSVAGEPTTMTVTAGCNGASANVGELAALSFPVTRITSEKPRNKSFTFNDHNATVSFTNVADQWPTTWVLKQIRFQGEQGTEAKAASFGRTPASATTENPIILQF